MKRATFDQIPQISRKHWWEGESSIFSLSLSLSRLQMYICTWSLTKPGEQQMSLDISYEDECDPLTHIYRDRRIDRLRLSCVNPDRMEILQGKVGKEHKLAKMMNEDINGKWTGSFLVTRTQKEMS